MTPHPSASPERPLPSIASPVAAAVLAAMLVVATWWFFVGTRRGQLFDALAMDGSTIGAWRLDDQAERLLQTVSVPAVAAMMAIVLVIGLLRGAWLAAIAGATAIAGANVTTQVLKYGLFSRADLIDAGPLNLTNTLPSGHTTVAAAGLVGLMLVVPPRLRSLTAGFGVVAVPAFGFSTLVSQWHRPSDVLAAVLVACLWGCLGVVLIRVGEHAGRRRDDVHRPGPASVALITLAIGGIGLTAAAIGVTWGLDPDLSDRRMDFVAYAGGVAALLGVTCGGIGTLLRLVDATRPRKRERVELGGISPAPVRQG